MTQNIERLLVFCSQNLERAAFAKGRNEIGHLAVYLDRECISKKPRADRLDHVTRQGSLLDLASRAVGECEGQHVISGEKKLLGGWPLTCSCVSYSLRIASATGTGHMSPFRYQDEESPATGALYIALGALAGFAAGIVVAQHYGGITGLTDSLRERIGRSQARGDTDEHETYSESDDEYDDHERPLDPTEALEERVLEAFRNDPILSERAIDIG